MNTFEFLGDFAGRTEKEVPARGEDIEAVRSSQHRPLHRHLRSEATHYDRHGTRARRQPSQFPEESRRQSHTEESPRYFSRNKSLVAGNKSLVAGQKI